MTTHHKFVAGIDHISKSRYYADISDALVSDPEQTISKLKHNIQTYYYPNGLPNTGKCSEKYIQWRFSIQSTLQKNIIDTEFAYNLDKDIPDLRIDMVSNDKGNLTFIELKRINDKRLLNKDGSKAPEIMAQMQKYADFIQKHSGELIAYYRTIFDIKRMIGLKTSAYKPVSINPKPHLYVANLYDHTTTKRLNHINGITKWLANQDHFTYEITSMNE